MPRKSLSSSQIIQKLRQADLLSAQGQTIEAICREIGVSESAYYKWRKKYGGMSSDQAKQLRDLEAENKRLKRAVADLTLDNQILKDVAEGNC